MDAWLARAREAMPWLRQSVACWPFRLRPSLVTDERPDLDKHLRFVNVDPGADLRDLLDLTAQLTSPPLPDDRPPWEVIVIGGLPDGRAAIVQRAHHSLLDGWEGIKLLRTLLQDGHPASPHSNGKGAERGMQQPAAGRLPQLVRRTLDLVPNVRSPSAAGDLARQAWETAGLIVSQALAAGPLSPLMQHRSTNRRFEIHSVCRQAAQQAARVLGGNLNVFFIAGLAGGLGAYHRKLSAPCPALRIGTPVGLPRGGASGNHFSPLRLIAPTDPHPVRRFEAVRDVLHRSTTQPGLAFTQPLAEIINLLPDAILLPAVRAQARSTDCIASFLPGPRGDHRWADANVTANYPFGPLFGTPVNATAITFGAHLHIGIHLDPEAVTEPAALMDCLRDSFDQLVEQGTARHSSMLPVADSA